MTSSKSLNNWPYWLYNIFTYLLVPFLPLRLWWRGRREPAYRERWRERFGIYPKPLARVTPRGKKVWVHAVSVGETRAAATLIKALWQQYPAMEVLLTHMTPTGLATAQSLFPEISAATSNSRIQQVYLPYDLPGAVRRFLQYHQPDCGIILETELWPNLFAEAAQQKKPLLLVNARLSERSARKYYRIRPLIQATLAHLRLVVAQTQEDAERLVSLGAKEVVVSGNVKFDQTPPDGYKKLAEQIRENLGAGSIWLWASTREGEEFLLLDAWQKVHSKQVKLIVVPRHSARFGEVAQMFRSVGYRVVLRSGLTPGTTLDWQHVDVLLGDSMGELYSYYAAADLALIGGSILPFGSQNLIEACAVGTPVLLGPSTFNFAQASQLAVEQGAAVQVQDVPTLMRTALALIDDPHRLHTMAQMGVSFAQQHRGATQQTIALCGRFLEETQIG